MEELELRFDDEAGIYLPQVVAEENRRKANENERIANEEQRKANESERIANEEYRKETMAEIESEVDSLIDEMNANLKKISYIKRFRLMYTTAINGETTFKLPSEYTNASMLDVRVNGFTLNETEYTVDTANLTIVLTNPVTIGTVVEVVVTRLTTAHIEDYDVLKGDKGDPPTRGVDYWTNEDINEIKAYCDDYIESQITEVVSLVDELNGEGGTTDE